MIILFYFIFASLFSIYAEEENSQHEFFLYPTNQGQAGTLRVTSAEAFNKGTLTFGIGAEFYTLSSGPDFGSGSHPVQTIAENIFVGYSPWEKVNLSVVRRSSSTTFGSPKRLISSLGDVNFTGLYSIPVGSLFYLAPLVHILVASDFNDITPSGSTLSAGIGLAGTLSLRSSISLPLAFHGNILFDLEQIRSNPPSSLAPESFYGFSRYNTFHFMVGGEAYLGDFIAFIEMAHTAYLSSGLGYFENPAKMTVGTRITPLSNKSLCLSVGADIALKSQQAIGVAYTPSYQILGQVSYTVGLLQTERKHYHTTEGVDVVDRKLIVQKNINFKINSAELTLESEPILDEISEVIKKNNVQKLLIVGHTDSTHTEEYNLELSEKRAKTVKDGLVKRGVESSAIETQGMGRRKPKASNLTNQGRSQNRRVEFFILE